MSLVVSQCSGYYKWRGRGRSMQAIYREKARASIHIKFTALKMRYGAPRLVTELNDDGIPCSLNLVAKLMSEEGLKARNGKNFSTVQWA